MGAAIDTAASPTPALIGLDIAKPAIQLAARRYRDAVTWLVASGAQLPLPDASLDAITCLFTQLHVHEMQRVLRPGGLLLVVTPAADHLWHLRDGLFDTVQPHEPDKFLETLGDGFALQHTQTLRFDLELDAVDLSHLLAMTPYAWKAKPHRREALARQPGLRTSAAFGLLALRRAGRPGAAGPIAASSGSIDASNRRGLQ
jgi:23S rRNA (guanine745-N1)-methyltransferase